MVQAIVNLGKFENRILTLVKSKYGLKNKSEAVNFVIGKYWEDIFEPELKPEFVKKIKCLEKQKRIHYKSIEDLKRHIENE
jgi:hypothetical protein